RATGHRDRPPWQNGSAETLGSIFILLHGRRSVALTRGRHDETRRRSLTQMFGFFIGAACLFGLGMMWRRARWRRWHGHRGWGHGYGGCARGGWDDGPWAGPYGPGHRRTRGFGPMGWLLG